MDRHTLMRTLSLLLLCASALSAADRPNVLFIAIDDLVPRLGCYGDPIAQSDQIDTLASQGTVFLNHHVQWSVCGPSRASMSTSLMPEETEVTGFKPIRAVLPDVITLPQHFKNNGYETACAGKFHDNRTVGTFDIDGNLNTDGKDVDDPASWSIAYNSAGGSGFNPTGKPAVDYTDQADSAYVDHDILTKGMALIDTIAAGSKPFFLAVGFKKPHLGFYAPKQYWDLYDTNLDGDYSNDMPLPTFTGDPAGASSNVVSMLDNNELLGYEPYDTTGLPTDAQARELKHGYYACISMIDTFVGQLLDKLAATTDPVDPTKTMDETTIVVIWGDHGFYLGEHSRWAKHSNLETATSAPLIIYDPRSPTTGASTNSPVNSLDIYPTLCELAALPIPEQPTSDTVLTGRSIRGRSLVPILEDPEASVHSGAISHFSKSGDGFAYRTERFRYIEWINNSNAVIARDLYDYQNDPQETVNLAADPSYASIVYQLSKAMRAEPATQGITTLQDAALPVAPADLTLPFLEVQGVNAGMLGLTWPAGVGSTYRLMSTLDLASGFTEHTASITGNSHEVSTLNPAEFFLVEIDDNTPPRFLADPILVAVATEDSSYASSLAAAATDPDVGEVLSFAKLAGPAWMTVAANGDLSGTPLTADIGANYFTVQVTDSEGATQVAALQITVVEASGDGGEDTALHFEPVADTYVKAAVVDGSFGTRSYLELRQDGGNSSRLAYLRFEVTGVTGAVQSVTLQLTRDPAVVNAPGEADNIAVHDVSNDSWIEDGTGSMTWTNKPSLTSPAIATIENSAATMSVDLSSIVTGNGTYSIALDELGDSVGRVYSREHSVAAERPQLVIAFD